MYKKSMVEFDPAKDASNKAKHGISLARAADMTVLAVIEDHRYYELRYRAYGLIDGIAHCLAFSVRDDNIRAISLRRAHSKEVKRYVP